MPARTTRRWTDVRGAAQYSGYSVRTIRQRIADGDLAAYIAKGSRTLRVDLNDVDAMIEIGRLPTGHLPVPTS